MKAYAGKSTVFGKSAYIGKSTYIGKSAYAGKSTVFGKPIVFGKFFVFALGALLAFGGLAPAQASLIHDLTVTQLRGFTGSGRIEFFTQSGTSKSGVKAFSFSGRFTGTAFGNPVDETFVFNSPAQILNISWSIDPATSALTLNLGSNLVPGPVAPAQYCVLLQNDNAGGTCGGGVLTTTSGFSRAARQTIGSTSTGLGRLSTTAVHEVLPEPATLALFGLGLAGLGLAATRRRRTAR